MARDDGRTGSTLPAAGPRIPANEAHPEIAALIEAWEAADRDEAQATSEHALAAELLRMLAVRRDRAYRRAVLTMDDAGRALAESGPVVVGVNRYSGIPAGPFWIVVREPLPFAPEPDGPPVAHAAVSVFEDDGEPG